MIDELVCGCMMGCQRLANGARGLCGSCYTRALKAVKSGELTWEQLEAEGKAKPAVKVRDSRWNLPRYGGN